VRLQVQFPIKVTDASELLTVPEVAKLLKLSVTFVWREVRAGTLPTIRLGRSVRVTRADLDSYLESKREIR
jgi:excisionase family DNA binding protein